MTCQNVACVVIHLCRVRVFGVCASVGEGGVIKGWEERTLNMSKAVRYNKEQGTFTVEKAGVYFLFCQVRSSK